MKFQDPSMHGSKVLVCIKKCDKPKAICPPTFFIKIKDNYSNIFTVVW